MFTVLRPIIKNVLMAYFFGHSHYGTLYCQDRQRHRATTRATTTASPSSKTYAHFRAFHRAFRARKSYPFHHQARQTRTACHSIFSNSYHVPRQTCHTAFTPKLSVYTYQQLRRLPNDYTLLLNASTTYTTCRPGVEASYTSICLSFGNSLPTLYSDG